VAGDLPPGHSVRAALLDLLPGRGQFLLRRLRREIRSGLASSGEALDEGERHIGDRASPLSIVSACPRFAISTISVTPSLLLLLAGRLVEYAV
jgi:hypothetical protein